MRWRQARVRTEPSRRVNTAGDKTTSVVVDSSMDRYGTDEWQTDPMQTGGLIGIVDQSIRLQVADGVSSFPTLTMPDHDHVRILVNGVRVRGDVILRGDDAILVETDTLPPQVDVDVIVSDDRLEVRASVVRRPGSTWHLADTPLAEHVVIQVVEVQISPPRLSVSRIRAVVTASGCSGQWDEEALSRLASGEAAALVVLRGKAPQTGVSAHCELLPLPAEYDPLHRRMRMNLVTMGTVIAKVVPAEAGQPGCDVYGQPIQPSPPPPSPLPGPGVRVIADRVVAACDGRVVATAQEIDVIAELEMPGDLTVHDGAVEFPGDVVVLGDVQDGATIQAGGTITVRGSVFGARLSAERGIFVAGNAVHSQLYAGQLHRLCVTLEPFLGSLAQAFAEFRASYVTVVETALHREGGNRKIPMVASVLLDQRYPELMRGLRSLIADEYQPLWTFDSHFRQMTDEIRARWIDLQRTSLTLSDIDGLRLRLTQCRRQAQIYLKACVADVCVSSLTSSVVHASGHVRVVGVGVFASSVEAGDGIVVEGFVRGGFLSAKCSIRAGEAGTPLGVETSLQVNEADGAIDLAVRHPNTLMAIAHRRDRNLETQRHVHFTGGE